MRNSDLLRRRSGSKSTLEMTSICACGSPRRDASNLDASVWRRGVRPGYSLRNFRRRGPLCLGANSDRTPSAIAAARTHHQVVNASNSVSMRRSPTPARSSCIQICLQPVPYPRGYSNRARSREPSDVRLRNRPRPGAFHAQYIPLGSPFCYPAAADARTRRFAALVTARSEAITMLGSIPTPYR